MLDLKIVVQCKKIVCSLRLLKSFRSSVSKNKKVYMSKPTRAGQSCQFSMSCLASYELELSENNHGKNVFHKIVFKDRSGFEPWFLILILSVKQEAFFANQTLSEYRNRWATIWNCSYLSSVRSRVLQILPVPSSILNASKSVPLVKPYLIPVEEVSSSLAWTCPTNRSRLFTFSEFRVKE